MCILVAAHGGSTLWVAANRDELLQRPWEPPQLLQSQPPVFGGKDLIGGGSWLATNLEAGFVVGVTNARRGALPGERSRGSLVVDLAAEESLPAAVALLTELDLTRYGSFNLLLADPADFWVATNRPSPRVEQLTTPLVAIGNTALDGTAERVSRAAQRVAVAVASSHDPIDGLKQALIDHEGEDPLCRHGEYFGTVCSTIMTLGGGPTWRYLFAQGPPCTAEFTPIDLPVPPRH